MYKTSSLLLCDELSYQKIKFNRVVQLKHVEKNYVTFCVSAEKFRLNFLSSSFVIRVNLLHP